jgi:signal transduction histidine kinase
MDNRPEPVTGIPRRATWMWRLSMLMSFAILGIATTLVIWWSAMRDSNRMAAASLSQVAREIHSVLNVRVERHVEALRNLAQFWQLHGLLPQEAWDFNCEMMIRNFRGIEWIAWVNGRTGSHRFASRDTTLHLDESIVRMARERARTPGMDSRASTSGSNVLVFTPVRTPQDSIGVLVAAISPAKLVGHEYLTSGDIIAYSVTGGDGREIYRYGEAAHHVPGGMSIEQNLPQAFGDMWIVRYDPTPKYLLGVVSRWHNYFLLTGVLLSLALGAIAFQFVTLREYSVALAVTNRKLDAQVRELSERDLMMRRMNDELEQRVEARTAQLGEAMKELEAFSHSMSHDLRSPIGAILNYSSILEEDFGQKLDTEGLRVLHRIRDSGQSATRLLDQLVQFVWLGREKAEKSDVNMTMLAREAFQEVSAGLPADHLKFDLTELPQARGNAPLLGRVFRNLLSNSVKYTRRSQAPRIAVGGEERSEETAYWVEDNGIGFDPAQAETLFEPFRRLHSSNDYEGAGLGLAIVAKIVRRHGGRVWAESNGVGGARFGFSLPRDGVPA